MSYKLLKNVGYRRHYLITTSLVNPLEDMPGLESYFKENKIKGQVFIDLIGSVGLTNKRFYSLLLNNKSEIVLGTLKPIDAAEIPKEFQLLALRWFKDNSTYLGQTILSDDMISYIKNGIYIKTVDKVL